MCVSMHICSFHVCVYLYMCVYTGSVYMDTWMCVFLCVHETVCMFACLGNFFSTSKQMVGMYSWHLSFWEGQAFAHSDLVL